MTQMTMSEEKRYPVRAWGLGVRLFHWINVLCILGLIALGLMILNSKAFGIAGPAKVLLKEVHAWFGYVFVTNLVLRLILAFVGPADARWRAFLPVRGAARYLGQLARGRAASYAGHNPAGRIAVTLLFVSMLTQAGTGIVLAGTDLYQGPLGGYMAGWASGGDPAIRVRLVPGDAATAHPEGWKAMRAFREPIEATHLYNFYVLLGLILLHVAGVVVAEARQQEGLISAMVNGRKLLGSPPVDRA